MTTTTIRAPGADDAPDDRTATDIARDLIAAGAGADPDALIDAHLLVLCGVICAASETAVQADAAATCSAATLIGTVRGLVMRPAGESVQ